MKPLCGMNCVAWILEQHSLVAGDSAGSCSSTRSSIGLMSNGFFEPAVRQVAAKQVHAAERWAQRSLCAPAAQCSGLVDTFQSLQHGTVHDYTA